MKRSLPVLLALVAAIPALAEEKPLSLPFTWSAQDLVVLDAGGDNKAALTRSELVMTGTAGTPFDDLVGSCLMLSHFNPKTPDQYDASGDCMFTNASGDRIFERFEEANGKGKGKLSAGTGGLAGLTAEYTYEGAWHGSPDAVRNAGTGLKTGTYVKGGS